MSVKDRLTSQVVSQAAIDLALTPVRVLTWADITSVPATLQALVDLTPSEGFITFADALGNMAVVVYGTTAGTVCQGDDSRLSDARTPLAHNQAWSTITATPTTLAGYGITDGLKTTNNLSDVSNAGTARTNLGLGTLATQSGTFSGTSSGTNTGDQTITLTGNVTGSGTGSFATTIAAGAVTNAMLAGSIDLTSKVTGTLPVANGGTGLTSLNTIGRQNSQTASGLTGATNITLTAGVNELILDGDGTEEISNISGGLAGRPLLVHSYVGSVLKHENGGTASQRIHSYSGSDIAIAADGCVLLWYLNSRWYVIASSETL